MVSERLFECPICKKLFLPAPQHAWDISGYGTRWERLVCSYHCMREWERKQEAKPEEIRRRARIEKELAGGFGGCCARK